MFGGTKNFQYDGIRYRLRKIKDFGIKGRFLIYRCTGYTYVYSDTIDGDNYDDAFKKYLIKGIPGYDSIHAPCNGS